MYHEKILPRKEHEVLTDDEDYKSGPRALVGLLVALVFSVIFYSLIWLIAGMALGWIRV